MTLDESINKEEALAYSFGERYKRLGEPVGDLPELEAEHEQYAEWLKELKAYREAEKEIEQELVNWDDIDNGKCRGLFLATSIIQHYRNKEVNADE